MKLRENCWLWGHPERRYNNAWGNTQPSRMTPMECCLYLGIKNCFMVPLDVNPIKRQYNKSFTTLRNVSWEVYEAAKDLSVLDPILEEAKEFKNITTVSFDDFVRDGKYKEIKIEDLWKCKEKCKNNDVRPLDMWMVLYTNEFGFEEEKWDHLDKYIEPFDGVMMWTWEEKDVPLIPAKYEKFKELTPNNRRLFGCYLWNFGEKKPATSEAVKWQLEFYYDKIMKGEAEGIIFHTNTMADLDLEAYDTAIEWLKEHGDDELPEVCHPFNK